MGNAPSIPENAGRQGKVDSSPPPPLAPPSWKNAATFKVISPASDLSNPSNVYGKQLWQQTPVRERRRGSQVMAKQTNIRTVQTTKLQSSLPQPGQFYFIERQSIEGSDECQRQLQRPKPRCNTYHGRPYKLRQKAARAKQILSGCFDNGIQHKRLVSRESASKVNLLRHSEADHQVGELHEHCVQFDPNLSVPSCVEFTKESSFLHDPKNYFDSIAPDDSKECTPMGLGRKNLAQESILEEDEDVDSPVAALFEKSANVIDDKFAQPTQVAVMNMIQGATSNHKNEQVKAKTLSNDSESMESIVTGPVLPVTANEFDKMELWLRAVLEIKNKCKEAKVCKNVPRNQGSIETTETGPSPYTLRKSVQENIQNQINQKLESHRRSQRGSSSSGRSQRGRSPEPRPRRSNNEASSMAYIEKQLACLAETNVNHKEEVNPISESNSLVNANREIHEGKIKQRATSLPPSQKKSAAHKRALSMPPANKKLSAEIPILLQLTGWEAPPRPSRTVPSITKTDEPKTYREIPALLKLAGWQKHSEKAAGSQCKKLRHTSLPTQGRPLKLKDTRMSTKSANPRLQGHLAHELQSLPLDHLAMPKLTKMHHEPRANCVTTATMLQQTNVLASYTAIRHDQYRNKENELLSQPKLAFPSPDSSVKRPSCDDSPASIELVSKQAEANAEFLFSMDGNILDGTAASHKMPSISITTLDSRNRYCRVAASSKSILIPASTSICVDQRSRDSSERRVHFSAGEIGTRSPFREKPSQQAPSTITAIPNIECKVSDLTEAVEYFGEGLNQGQEERYNTNVSIATGKNVSPESLQTDVVDDHTDNYTANRNENSSNDIPVMNWSYNSFDKGVTPLLNGKHSNHTTNSPFLRFQQAREMFSKKSLSLTQNLATHQKQDMAAEALVELNEKSSETSTKGGEACNLTTTALTIGSSPAHLPGTACSRFKDARNKFSSKGSTKESPIKRQNKVKRSIESGLVQSRVAQMEFHGRPTSSTVPEKPKRRATTGHKVIAPRRAKLVSPHFKEPLVRQQNTSLLLSPTLVNGEWVNYPPDGFCGTMVARDRSIVTANNTVVENRTQSSFGDTNEKIQPAVVIEDTDDDDDGGDVFAQLLNGPGVESADDNDDVDESSCEETVTTVQQDCTSLHPSRVFSNCSTSNGDTATIFSSSERSDATMSTVLQKRLSFASSSDSTTLSSLIRKHQNTLSFRDEAPVKPNEQNHHKVPGALILSPMQRTPMQARKWRALATAAREPEGNHKTATKKNHRGYGSTLSERNTNVDSFPEL